MSLLPRLRPAVERLRAYNPPKEGRAGLRLDFNENTIGCPPRVLEVLREITGEDLARYPEYAQGEDAIAQAFGHTPATMTLTNGVDDAILLAVQCFVDSGDEMIIVEPTFTIYRFYGELTGAHLMPVRWREREITSRVRRFELDSSALRAALTPQTRLVIIASPNNPTGHLTPPAELLDWVRAAPQTAFLVDEAYADFVAPGYRGLLDAVRTLPNLLVARTFSKSYGLAGLRLGSLFAHPELMPVLRKAHSPYNVNTLAIRCALAALRDQDWLEDYRRQIRASREHIQSVLAVAGIAYWQSEANFVLFEAGERADSILSGLRRQGILIRDRRGDYPGALRITCGTQEQTERALAALLEFWT